MIDGSTLRLLVVGSVLLSGSLTAQGRPADRTTGRTVTELARRPLPELPGHEMVVLQFTFPPGYVGLPHTHTGTLVAFVVSGGFDVEVDGLPLRSYVAGEVYQELADRVMRLRTQSQRDTTRLVAFQVVPAGASAIVPVLPPGIR